MGTLARRFSGKSAQATFNHPSYSSLDPKNKNGVQMSTRTHMVSIKSLDPIRDAIGSGDASLAEALMQRYSSDMREYYDGEEPEEEELEEFKQYVDSMVMCSQPPDKEPGCWNYIIELLAAHHELDPVRLPLEDWKHVYVWEDYRSVVEPLITPESKQSLQFLDAGRPLKGSGIDYDGCVFGWLTLDEATELHETLTKIDAKALEQRGLDEFHEELLDSLGQTKDKGAVLFMAAH